MARATPAPPVLTVAQLHTTMQAGLFQFDSRPVLMLRRHRQWELRYAPFNAQNSRAHDAAARAHCARSTRGDVLSAPNQARRESAQPLLRKSCIKGSMSRKSRLGRRASRGQQKAGTTTLWQAAVRQAAEAAGVSLYAPQRARSGSRPRLQLSRSQLSPPKSTRGVKRT